MNGWGEIVAANLRDVIDRRDQAGEMVTNEIANKAASNDRVRWSDGAAQPMTEKRIGMIHRNVPARVWRIRKVERGRGTKEQPFVTLSDPILSIQLRCENKSFSLDFATRILRSLQILSHEFAYAHSLGSCHI